MIGDKCPNCGFVEREYQEGVSDNFKYNHPHKCDCNRLPYIKKKEQKDEQ